MNMCPVSTLQVGQTFPRRHVRSAAFTLVELLTVIAVIAILAAILIPVVGSVRKRAATAKSISNLRQLGVAMIAFQTDNKGRNPPLADWSWSFQNQGIWGGKSWDYYLWSYIGIPGADYSTGSSPTPGRASETLLFHPSDAAGEDAQNRCRRTYAMAWAPPLGIFPGWQPDGQLQAWGGPINKVQSPSRVIMLTERPGNTGSIAGEGGYADIVTPYDQIQGQRTGSDDDPVSTLNNGGKFNYLFWDGHVATLAPLATTGSTHDLRRPGGFWTTDPSDD